MPFLVEDPWINAQASHHDISELEDCALGVDATYYLSQLLDNPPSNEPLLSALGGMTAFEYHINLNLDNWAQFKITPFFVFDGQTVVGQDEVIQRRALQAIKKTDEAWNMYTQGQAEEAVSAFGANPGAFNIKNLYPLLQKILKERGLHFLVAPFSANGQLAYFEMIDSDQCGGVMGSQELLLYPIKDVVIRGLDFDGKTVSALSKKKVLRNLTPTASESRFIDCFMMLGTSILPTFPTLLDITMYPHLTISNAANLLRTQENNVATASAAFNDLIQHSSTPDWLDRFYKARMIYHHFFYIAENGKVTVHSEDTLTGDNHLYFGVQLPAELFHYLNTGLISSRLLSYITHNEMLIQPTLDGVASDEYKNLVTKSILPIREQALSLLIARLQRGIQHKDINMRVWFDKNFSYAINQKNIQPLPTPRVMTWNCQLSDMRKVIPDGLYGPVALEVLLLANDELVKATIAKEKIIKGIDSVEMITSITLWRFLHLRGYVNDDHKLTNWGNALATTLLILHEIIGDINEGHDMPSVTEAALLAFELVRFGLLNGKYIQDQPGLPRNGTDEERESLVLISQCASLLKLRHENCGYTGPLNKSLLTFRGLSSTVREADRDLLEAIVASMFLWAQSQRERDDQVAISQSLPFLSEPDIGMGIAVRTFFDEDKATDDQEARAARLQGFPEQYVPFAQNFEEDLRIACGFVEAIGKGVQSHKDFPAADKAAWSRAQEYIKARPF